MTEIEIGRGKRARRAYSFDDIAVVPSRRTRDPRDVSISWTIDALTFEIPVLAAPMDSVVSPATAIAIGRLGGPSFLESEIARLTAINGNADGKKQEREALVAQYRSELTTVNGRITTRGVDGATDVATVNGTIDVETGGKCTETQQTERWCLSGEKYAPCP